MKMVPLHAFVRDTAQQNYAFKQGDGPSEARGPGGKAPAMRARRFGESAEATTAATGRGAGGGGGGAAAISRGSRTGPHMVPRHTVHLPRGALLSPCTVCGTGRRSRPRR